MLKSGWVHSAFFLLWPQWSDVSLLLSQTVAEPLSLFPNTGHGRGECSRLNERPKSGCLFRGVDSAGTKCVVKPLTVLRYLGPCPEPWLSQREPQSFYWTPPWCRPSWVKTYRPEVVTEMVHLWEALLSLPHLFVHFDWSRCLLFQEGRGRCSTPGCVLST